MVIFWVAWLIAPLCSIRPTFAVYVPTAEYLVVWSLACLVSSPAVSRRRSATGSGSACRQELEGGVDCGFVEGHDIADRSSGRVDAQCRLWAALARLPHLSSQHLRAALVGDDQRGRSPGPSAPKLACDFGLCRGLAVVEIPRMGRRRAIGGLRASSVEGDIGANLDGGRRGACLRGRWIRGMRGDQRESARCRSRSRYCWRCSKICE